VLREIKLLRLFSDFGCKHVVRLLDLILVKDSLFIVMEYMPFDLKKVMSNSVRLQFSEEDAKWIVYQILCSLNYLNSANVIHRDIKPSNILLDKNFRVKLCDLGLSRSMPSEKGLKRSLSNHVVARWYRPPEIILVQKNYTSKVDIWSTGCVLSEMLYCAMDHEKRALF
jgi:mitogen-activated protein kinase 1/3